jgi:DNA polymerase-3 subunit alpha
MNDFVHLHNHTCYSLLDGACKIREMVNRAAELGMEALAMTDHGVMYGAVEFYKACKSAGVHPVLGCEVYVAPRSRWDKVAGLDESPYHLVLLAETQEGYQNLIKLVSKGWLEGFYYKPRVDKALLKQYSKGLIALSACLAGEIPSHLLQGRKDQARQAAADYLEIFGKNNFFLELQDHGIEGQRQVNAGLLALSREMGLETAATNDVHYIHKDDAFTQDVMLCIQTGKSIRDTDRMRFDTQEFYLKSRDEMNLLFGDYPEALANTLEIARRCRVDFEFGVNRLPRYPLPEGQTDDGFLAEICLRGLDDRYVQVEETHRERLRFELATIQKMGFSSYFLIVWDFIRFAKEQGIVVGPGRGSAAGSIVAYTLGITNIDPLKYDLLFERFLNPERVSMPDIDIDFCYERRGEIIEYVIERYGRDHVAQIITFGTIAARSGIRDAGRAMGMALSLVDKVSKMVPLGLGVTLARALESSPELAQLVNEDEQVRELLRIAQSLEGMPRHAGTHAAGLVISNLPLDHYLPLQKTSDGLPCTQFEKDTVESIGLLKMDLLGLRTLTVIRDAIQFIRENHGIELDMDRLSLEDEGTYRLLSEGDTIGVFQLESSGLRAILREMKPDRFEDIVALVALYRPGPLGSGMVEDYIRRRHGQVSISYLHPLLAPVLESTYGVILYQEQVMRIASEIGGFTLGEADQLRRAMSKKKPEVLAGYRQQFLDGAGAKGVDPSAAAKIFELMEFFAGYGFNKSHSAAYALLAYQTAYLKARYPAEFMAALLSSVIESKDRVPFYIEECRQRKIEILHPDVNESRAYFTVAQNKIRFGLAAIKQVGLPAIESILKEREKNGPYESLQSFCRRVDLSHVNRRALENLIRSGAFGSMEGNRAQLLAVMSECVDRAGLWQKQSQTNQMTLFDFAAEDSFKEPVIPLPAMDEFSQKEILKMEKDVIGLYLSGHPLTPYVHTLSKKTGGLIGELNAEQDGLPLVLGGIITNLRRSVTKKGQMMVYLTLEDLTGTLEVLVFPKTFARYSAVLEEDVPVLVRGRLSADGEQIRMFAEELEFLREEDGRNPPDEPGKLYLNMGDRDHEDLTGLWREIQGIIGRHPGSTPLYLYYPKARKLVETDHCYWVRYSGVLTADLESLLGTGQVKLVEK